MIEHYFSRMSVVARCRLGPLAPYLDDFATTLQQQGYKPDHIRVFLRACGQFSQWLSQQEKIVTPSFCPKKRVFQSWYNGPQRA